jgi:transcriptional regulator with XRE-family HTH domain
VLLAARARSGLTQAEIAARMGTTQSAVARLESGKTKPSLRTLEKFAAATGSRLTVALEEA